MSDYDYDEAHRRNSGSGIDDDYTEDQIAEELAEKIDRAYERLRDETPEAQVAAIGTSLKDCASTLRNIARVLSDEEGKLRLRPPVMAVGVLLCLAAGATLPFGGLASIGAVVALIFGIFLISQDGQSASCRALGTRRKADRPRQRGRAGRR